jgi:hypothetical protein
MYTRLTQKEVALSAAPFRSLSGICPGVGNGTHASCFLVAGYWKRYRESRRSFSVKPINIHAGVGEFGAADACWPPGGRCSVRLYIGRSLSGTTERAQGIALRALQDSERSLCSTVIVSQLHGSHGGELLSVSVPGGIRCVV